MKNLCILRKYIYFFNSHLIDFQGAGGDIFRGADGVEYRGVEFVPDGETKEVNAS